MTTTDNQLDMDANRLKTTERLNITYKTASPIDPRKAALGDIKDKIRDAVRYFNEDFGPLTDAEKASIKSLECLRIGGADD